MDEAEIERRAALGADFLGEAFAREGRFSFDGEGERCRGRPLVLYRGPTTRALRRTFADAGFAPSDDARRFNVFWGVPQSAAFMRALAPGQRVAHLSGQWALVRKDGLARTLEAAVRRQGQAFRIAPRSFSLPEELE